MSDVDFLVGKTVVAVQESGTRIIFELGEKPEPALYADVGLHTYRDDHGVWMGRFCCHSRTARYCDASLSRTTKPGK